MYWGRLIVLVAYGNEVLAQRATTDAIESHSAFEQCESFNFKGYNLQDWFRELRRSNCQQLLLINSDEVRAQTHQEAPIKEWWQSPLLEDYDLIRLKYLDRLENWRIEYISWVKDSLYALPANNEPYSKLKHIPFTSLTICAEVLEKTIAECFQYEAIAWWVERFQAALEILHGHSAVADDTMPINGYSLLARRVFKAASTIRGIIVGNSSWSDQCSDTVPLGFISSVYTIATNSEIMAINSYDRTLEFNNK